MVSVSRNAGFLHFGQGTFTQSVAPASGEIPLGFKSSPAEDGNLTGN